MVNSLTSRREHNKNNKAHKTYLQMLSYNRHKKKNIDRNSNWNIQHELNSNSKRKEYVAKRDFLLNLSPDELLAFVRSDKEQTYNGGINNMKTEKIKINQIVQNENCRNRNVEIDSLMDSIKGVGMLEPIGVVKIANNRYEVLYGNRRFMAVKKLGYFEIDAIVYKSKSDADFKIVNLVENLQRKDVTIEDSGRTIHELRNLKLTDSEIGVRLSIPTSRVKKLADAFLIPEEYKKHISKTIQHGCPKKGGKVPLTTADSLMKMRKEFGMSKQNMNLLFEHAKTEGFGNENIRMVSALVKDGHSVKKAIQMQDDILMIRVNIPADKEQMKRLLKKHHTASKAEIIIKMLRGQIRERLITFDIK